MLLIKYEKTDSAKYIPHVDMLRHVARILRRAKISVDYSQGFNPHELIYFSPPIPLGISSKADYVAISTSENPQDFLKRFNEKSIRGLTASALTELDKNPNIAGKAAFATYSFSADVETLQKIEAAFSSPTFVISYSQKGERVEKDVRGEMFAFDFSGDIKTVTLSHGNKNLRADRFFGFFGVDLTTVEKIRQYIDENGKVIDVDRLF